MENVAASETVGGFQILGRDDLHAFDQAGEIRRIVGKSSDDDRTEFPATEVPIPVPQFIRRKLHAGGEDVLAFGREFGIENRGDADVEIGRWRKFAVLGSVKGALEIIDFRTDVNAAGERSEEHTSELQSHHDLVCRLLLEKKKKKDRRHKNKN